MALFTDFVTGKLALLNLLLVLLVNLIPLYFSGDNNMQKSDTSFLSFSFHSLYWSDLLCLPGPQGLGCIVVVMACLFFPCLKGNVLKGIFFFFW